VSIFKIFKSKKQREEEEQTQIKSCIDFIYEYTEIHGVRETTRKLNEIGYKISAPTISEIRNGNSDYGFNGIVELAEAISNLGIGGNEKKSH